MQRGWESTREILERGLERRQRVQGWLQTDVDRSWTRGVEHHVGFALTHEL